ncbi:MAG: 50S ribosomal protein L1 [Elusimicrobia bacterium]|nr:50S ribosomal protein L1 [Elusimicrobiota bacterium]
MGKRINNLKKKLNLEKIYSVEEAVELVKKNATAKFDETIEIHVKLGIDPKHSDQMVRNIISLPHGTGKTKKIAVIAKGEKAKEAQDAGADLYGGSDIIEQIEKGNMDFDVLVVTPDLMKDVAKLGKILGPRGLMPNPKSGTVTFDVKTAVTELKAGRIEFKSDAHGIVHSPIGKASFSNGNIVENLKAFVDALVRFKPSAAKGVYLQSIFITSTMGPSFSIDNNTKF